MLELRDVSFSYGGAKVLFDVSLSVGAAEAVCLLGMNGAGKTTLLSLVSGLARPASGAILLDGAPLPPRPAGIVAAGVVQVPEGRRVFTQLSVRENLEMGAYLRLKKGGRAERAAVADDLARMLDLFPVLGERIGQPAGNLSGGEQQMLAMGRALMARPRLLLLDEPSLGLAPKVTAAIFRVVRDLPSIGCSVLLVEQNALGALAICNRGYIITSGQIRFSGTSADILSDELLREAFLGPVNGDHRGEPGVATGATSGAAPGVARDMRDDTRRGSATQEDN
ncbi:ABC transporter ATP-binding protein [Nitratidesulfovibrio liaohensis]|uniref:ABC transporter ATP-binding protein n=1 Tax=Nitratidesulfovibrio liaohensis TaxID=2604158 RepID=A0ABY9R727_9BACT|nr:ABC transporter ATP-binding protein [Nitratidesulfovibrio liaohensis]WMW67111.1 ABC transporter ATP-binding protein [Nitratidesulfovibrio liaohensis]